MKNQEHQEKSLPSCAPLMEIVHSLHISSFMEKKTQLAFHKKVIFIRATFGGLRTLRGILINPSCFCFTLRTMFILSLGVKSKFKNLIFFQKSNFCISLPVLVIVFSCLVICMCFSFFLLFVLCLI